MENKLKKISIPFAFFLYFGLVQLCISLINTKDTFICVSGFVLSALTLISLIFYIKYITHEKEN